jgi:tripartite-type tricarboxylate transporter receptor subunit TctC
MGSAGTGGATHVAGELFKAMTGVNMVHVPYRGDAPALVDLMAGHVQVMFDLMPASIEYIKAGKLRALGVSTAVRCEGLPDLPTVGDFVPGYEASAWLGVGAPRNTPVEIIDKLNKEINAVLFNPKFKAQFADFGGMERKADQPALSEPRICPCCRHGQLIYVRRLTPKNALGP